MKNIVVCYEPGAGGDFFITLLSHSPDIFGDNILVHHYDDGRIKAAGQKSIYAIEDYEYSQNYEYSAEELLVKQNFNCTVSKIHPYLVRENEFEYKLKNRYSNSKIIMLHRDPKFCFLNDQHKNALRASKIPVYDDIENSIEFYNRNWYDIYEKIKINTDIIDVHFEDILTNPIRTLARVWDYADIRPNISDSLINVYKIYLSNQKYIEDAKRFWT